jgi:hypothetical protein
MARPQECDTPFVFCSWWYHLVHLIQASEMMHTPIVHSIVIFSHWSMLSLVDVHFGTHINSVLRPFLSICLFVFCIPFEWTHHHINLIMLSFPFQIAYSCFAFLLNGTHHHINLYYVVSHCFLLSHLFGHITITLGFIISQIVVVFHLTPIQHTLSSSFETTLLLLLLLLFSSQNSWPNKHPKMFWLT